MKIVILVSKFPPKWIAGTELAAYNIAKQLKKNNHDVYVITSYDEGLTNQNFNKIFNVHRVSSSKIRIFGYLLFLLKIIWLINKINPEVIHVQGLVMSIPAYLSKKLLNIPYIVSGQGSDVYGNWPFKRLITKIGLSKSKLAIALTEDMKIEMQKISNKQINVIPNGIDNEKFNLNKHESREKLELSEEDKIILYVGRLEPIKGLKYLIQAIYNIKDFDQNLKLLIIGEGKDLENLKVLIRKFHLENKIFFIGKTPNERIPEYMTASDLFVLPSLSEGLPIVLLEAIASGLPIITTRIRGLPEIVQEGINGFLVNPKNANQIADKIKLILNDEKLQKKLYIENKKKSKNYTWENIVKQLEIIYNF